MAELKKCPFCGEEVILRATINETNIVCMGEPWCGVRYSVPNDKDLIEKWNTRPLENALQSKLDIATKALEKIAEITGCSEEQGRACAEFMNETAQTALSQIKDK